MNQQSYGFINQWINICKLHFMISVTSALKTIRIVSFFVHNYILKKFTYKIIVSPLFLGACKRNLNLEEVNW